MFYQTSLNPNFAIELPPVRQTGKIRTPRPVGTPPLAGLTPLAPKRCVAARRADFANAKSGLNNYTFFQQHQFNKDQIIDILNKKIEKLRFWLNHETNDV